MKVSRYNRNTFCIQKNVIWLLYHNKKLYCMKMNHSAESKKKKTFTWKICKIRVWEIRFQYWYATTKNLIKWVEKILIRCLKLTFLSKMQFQGKFFRDRWSSTSRVEEVSCREREWARERTRSQRDPPSKHSRISSMPE